MLVYTTITFPIVQMNYTKLWMLYVFVLFFEAWNDMKPMHQTNALIIWNNVSSQNSRFFTEVQIIKSRIPKI